MSEALLGPVPGEHIRIATNSWTEPFWLAAKENRLVVATCGDCGRKRMPPSPFCPTCRSQAVAWPVHSGRGTVYSYSICHRSPLPGLVDNMTYAPAVVELDDAPGIRLVGDLVGLTVEEVAIGLPVEIVWNEVQGGWKVPLFRPVGRDG